MKRWQVRHWLKAVDLIVHCALFSRRCKVSFSHGFVWCEHDGCSWSLVRESWRLR